MTSNVALVKFSSVPLSFNYKTKTKCQKQEKITWEMGGGGGGICMMIGYSNKTKVKYMKFAGKVPL